MEWHDSDGSGRGAELQVAATLAHSFEADALKRAGGFLPGDPREGWAHAGTSTGVMMSGSGMWSSGSSSK